LNGTNEAATQLLAIIEKQYHFEAQKLDANTGSSTTSFQIRSNLIKNVVPIILVRYLRCEVFWKQLLQLDVLRSTDVICVTSENKFQIKTCVASKYESRPALVVNVWQRI